MWATAAIELDEREDVLIVVKALQSHGLPERDAQPKWLGREEKLKKKELFEINTKMTYI